MLSAIKVAQPIGLKPVGQNPEQQMAGEVRGRSPPKDRVPSGSKFADIEIAQSRNLDVELLPIRDAGRAVARGMALRPTGGSDVESLGVHHQRRRSGRSDCRRSSLN